MMDNKVWSEIKWENIFIQVNKLDYKLYKNGQKNFFKIILLKEVYGGIF